MLGAIRSLLLKIVDDIDVGNSNTSEEEAIEQKIVESAIVFWFKDADAKSKNKLISYFREY